MDASSTDAFTGASARSGRGALHGLRANLAGAVVYAGLVIHEPATFPLYLPHAVGHVWAMGGIVILAMWSVHCALLAWSIRDRLGARDRLAMALPPLLCALAIVVCRWHYIVEWWFGPIHV